MIQLYESFYQLKYSAVHVHIVNMLSIVWYLSKLQVCELHILSFQTIAVV